MNGLGTVARERGAGEELAGPRRLAGEIPHSQPPRPIRVPAYLKPEFRRVVGEGLKMPLDQSGWRVSPKCTRWTRFWAPGGDDQLTPHRNGGSSKLLSLRECSASSVLCRRPMAAMPICRCSAIARS
jgi:hypothetical protein